MSKYPMPTAEGHYWAKLKTPTGYPDEEADDLRSVHWEVVQVHDNNGEGDEKWGVAVPGLAITQWPLDFVWGPKVPDMNAAEVRHTALIEALKSARGWVQHWKDDSEAKLRPTAASLEKALRDIDAALREAGEQQMEMVE